MKNKIRWLILILTIVAIAFYVYNKRSEFDFSIIIEIKWKYLTILILLNLLYRFITSYIFRETITPFGIKLTLVEYFGLSIISAFTNHLTPGRIGVVTKILFLKRNHNMDMAQFASYFMVQSILLVGSGAISSFFVTFLLNSHTAFIFHIRVILITLTIPMIALIVYVSWSIDLPNNTFFMWLKSLERAIKIIGQERLHLHKLIGLNFLSFVVKSIIFYILFLAINFHLSVYACFLLSFFISISNYINITPGNLGILEIIFAFFTQQFGLGFDVGLLAGGINRILNLIIILSLAPLFSYRLTKQYIKA